MGGGVAPFIPNLGHLEGGGVAQSVRNLALHLVISSGGKLGSSVLVVISSAKLGGISVRLGNDVRRGLKKPANKGLCYEACNRPLPSGRGTACFGLIPESRGPRLP